MPINYGRFAILNENERELCLQSAENLINKIKAEQKQASLN